ncbi:MAG: hypothetical protein ABI688_04285 [Bacteroidota bacterium]
MKNLLVILFSFVFISANAQTADEVIQKYSAAMGGLEAFNKINTAKLTGTLRTQGRDLPITTQIVNGKSMRADVQVIEQSVNNVYNNGKAWKINPFAGAPTATEVTGSELITFKAQASLANNLMDYKSRGHQVELIGQEDVDGIKTYKIKLTNKEDGKITTYFISTVNNMLVKSVSKKDIAGSEYDAQTFYSDIKQISGLQFCMHFITKVEGQVFQEVTYQKIELNVPVDEKIFIKPD